MTGQNGEIPDLSREDLLDLQLGRLRDTLHHACLGTGVAGVGAAEAVPQAGVLGVAVVGIERGRHEAAVGRERIDHPGQVLAEVLGDLAGPR